MDSDHETHEDLDNLTESSTEGNFVDEIAGEVTVPSSSHIEDIVPLNNSRVENNFNILGVAIDNEAGSNIGRPNLINVDAVGNLYNSRSSNNALRQVINLITQNPLQARDERIRRRFINLKYEILKRKLNILKLRKEGLLKQFDLKMKHLKTRLNFERKKLHVFRKKYRC